MGMRSQYAQSKLLRMGVGLVVATATSAGLLLAVMATPEAQAQAARRPQGFIGGVVESSKGPEVGVWVIAETTELPTKFVKIVVTGDGGRFMLPELPNATYNVWVRGYGLVDSKPVTGKPGQTLNLKATMPGTLNPTSNLAGVGTIASILLTTASTEGSDTV